MNPLKAIEPVTSDGPPDGAKFKHTYTPMGDKTKVDFEGDFKSIQGMSEADQNSCT